MRTEYEFIEPNLVIVRFHDDFDAEEAVWVWDRINEKVKNLSFFMLEVVMDDIGRATPEARRISADKLMSLPPRAIAIVGGDFGQRVLAKLVLTATVLLSGGKNAGKFFTDSKSARVWFQKISLKHS